MYLLIDSSLSGKVQLYLMKESGWRKKTYRAEQRNRVLLKFIDNFFKLYKVNIKELKGLAVVIGGGSFTSTRIAVTVANTLSFALKIPVIGVEQVDLKKISKLFLSPSFKKNKHYLSASYSGEPNIGKAKVKSKR